VTNINQAEFIERTLKCNYIILLSMIINLFNFLKWKEFETPEVIRVDTGVLGLCKYMHWTISKLKINMIDCSAICIFFKCYRLFRTSFENPS